MEPFTDKKQNIYNKLKELVQNDSSQGDKEKQNILKKLPQSFWKFMKQRRIDIDEVLVQIPRFLRLKAPQLNLIQANKKIQQVQNNNPKIAIDDLIEDLKIQRNKIVQIDQFCYALAPSCKINHSKLYEEGYLYGMDISSMFAVKCLDLQRDSKLLELCSAPGNKSMYACDLQAQVTVTGVQINQTRANVMNNLISKYGFSNRIKVEVQDATKYQSKDLFDRVLVDAQCTHEGSVKHLKKFTQNNQQSKQNNKNKNKLKENKVKTKQQQKQFDINHNPYTSQYDKKNQWSEQDFEKRFLDPIKLSNLYELQLNLIRNGFKMLKNEGIMVYSTCSIDQRQNEIIVEQLLKQNSDTAKLLDAEESLKDCKLFFRKGKLKQTVYFTPKLSMSGGMFISKIKKIQNESSNNNFNKIQSNQKKN